MIYPINGSLIQVAFAISTQDNSLMTTAQYSTMGHISDTYLFFRVSRGQLSSPIVFFDHRPLSSLQTLPDMCGFKQQVGLAQWIALLDAGGQELLLVRTRILEEDVTKQKMAKKVYDNNLITE